VGVPMMSICDHDWRGLNDDMAPFFSWCKKCGMLLEEGYGKEDPVYTSPENARGEAKSEPEDDKVKVYGHLLDDRGFPRKEGKGE